MQIKAFKGLIIHKEVKRRCAFRVVLKHKNTGFGFSHLLLIVQIKAFKGRIIHKEVKRRCAFRVVIKHKNTGFGFSHLLLFYFSLCN